MKDEAVEIYVQNIEMGKFFEIVVKYLEDKEKKDAISLASNYIISDLAGLMKEKNILISEIRISPEMFAKLINMVANGDLSSRATKDVLKIMFEQGGDPEKIVEERGLKQASDDGFMIGIVEEVIKNNSVAVEEFKNGKEKALQFLVGQGMKISKGKANPGALQKLLMNKFITIKR